MISPPETACPANTFTPSILGLESRPLRLEPRPFLCAIRILLLLCRRAARGARLGGRLLRRGLARGGLLRGRGGGRLGLAPGVGLRGGRPARGCARAGLDRRDLDPRQLLAVAGAPLVAALGLELEHV